MSSAINAKTVKEAIENAGFSAEISWSWQDLGSVIVEGMTVVVQNGLAFISAEDKERRGHGKSRLPTHPLYPTPIENSTITKIEKAIAGIK